VPVATVVKRSDLINLKSCPDGYVVIRRMTYGEKMHRMELTGKMRILSNKVDKDAVGEINMMNSQAQMWEFTNLILEHNLEHQEVEGGPTRPLNFKNLADIALLDPRIGEEIATNMDKMNNFEEDADVGNSSGASAPTSSSTAPWKTTEPKS
jgi:hypothetical protein